MKDEITILQSDKLLTKKFTLIDGEIQKTDYDKAFWYRYFEVELSSIKDLSECLFMLEDKPNRCVIRGQLLAGIDENQKVLRRKKATDDHPAYFGEKAEGHQWVCFDFDKIPDPLGLTSDEERRAYIVSLLGDEFKDVSYHYQWSSSAGINGWDTLSIHIWYWLEEPRTDSEMCRWAKDNGNVDDAIFRTVQPNYTARPKFIDMDDPIGPDRSGFVQREKDNVLVPKVPEPRKMIAKKRSQASSKSVSQRLNAICPVDGNARQKAATLLASHWDEGMRQDLAMAVSGTLLRSEWSITLHLRVCLPCPQHLVVRRESLIVFFRFV